MDLSTGLAGPISPPFPEADKYLAAPSSEAQCDMLLV